MDIGLAFIDKLNRIDLLILCVVNLSYTLLDIYYVEQLQNILSYRGQCEDYVNPGPLSNCLKYIFECIHFDNI